MLICAQMIERAWSGTGSRIIRPSQCVDTFKFDLLVERLTRGNNQFNNQSDKRSNSDPEHDDSLSHPDLHSKNDNDCDDEL
jgi:hypothetical protein